MNGLLSTALLVATPGIPLAVVVTWPVPRLRRRALALAPWAAAPALGLALYSTLTTGDVNLSVQVPGTFAGLGLGLDPIGGTFLLFTSLLWLVGGIFARGYHADDPNRDSFFGFFLLTMAGNLGLVVAGDILSFYLFFIVMAFSAYGLVVHARDEEAYRAGRIYIVLTLLGDVMLLVSLFSLGAAGAGAVGFGTDLELAWLTLASSDRIPGASATATLLVLGFGVKAGLAPLHVWLPLAHPVAPTVASALLSGAMIKAGLLAWMRFLPEAIAFPFLGGALMVVGTAAAFYGVALGLPQDDAKTVLAYSSASQMGFMAVAVGVMIRRPELTAVGLGAAALYAVHHGIAKGALFLSVGVADHAPRWAQSRWRPAILLSALLPALAVSGAPLTSGARAKGAIENALEELGGAWYHTIEPLLVVAALGTTLLLARFLVVLDRRALENEKAEERSAPWELVIPWALLVAIGATALFWIHGVRPVSEPDVPSVLHAPLHAFLPIVAGALIGWGVYRWPAVLGPLARLRIPPGDLVVLFEAVLRRTSRISREAVGKLERPPLRWLDRLRHSTLRAAQHVADHDILLMRGTIVGTIILVLTAILALSVLG